MVGGASALASSAVNSSHSRERLKCGALQGKVWTETCEWQHSCTRNLVWQSCKRHSGQHARAATRLPHVPRCRRPATGEEQLPPGQTLPTMQWMLSDATRQCHTCCGVQPGPALPQSCPSAAAAATGTEAPAGFLASRGSTGTRRAQMLDLNPWRTPRHRWQARGLFAA